MKILITYASTGAGHLKAAEALYNYIKENCTNEELELVDILKETNVFFRFFYGGGYSFLIRRALLLWRLFFWATDFAPLSFFLRPIGFVFDRLNSAKFSRLLVQKQFDCIISTHFFPAEISAYLKRRKKIHSHLMTVVTDFGVHRFWVSQGIDVYIVATEETKRELLKKSAKAPNIKILGIPVDSSFKKEYNEDALREKFKTEKNRFTVLLITGSFGIGPIEKVVELIHKDAQVLAVCAKNNRLYNSLVLKNYPGVRVFGFVDYISQLMSISDCVITKPGGMTISESLAKDLVPVFMTAIPGQETENVRVLSGYGIGLYARKISELKKIILDLKFNPQKVSLIKENISKIKHPDAVGDICHVVCQGSAGRACGRPL